MHFCRICRTENNLKYTTKELRRLQKKQHKDDKLLSVNATTSLPTQGNICHDCEERLHNFHNYGDDLEVDDLGTHEREDSPVIVDDDELLYNLFFKKVDVRRKKLKIAGTELQQRQQETKDIVVNTEEIIEVLTSRENTPVPTPLHVSMPIQVSTPLHMPHNANEQKIVAVIDLESEVDDDEEIIFHRVEPQTLPESENTKNAKTISPKNKKHKKSYDESQLRLIASLSLVSSDSEAEAGDGKDTTKIRTQQPASTASVSPLKIPSNISNSISLATDSDYKCKECDVTLSNAESLRVHQCLRAGVKCPVCRTNFPASQRLINHMRCKHRSYDDDDTLIERPRCAQDSAMTIRLRYLQRYTYYECQLCGRIDAVFREHKQHVMQQHAAESKSLKDPMMKEVKCPICKEKCGIQYLALCKHILGTHAATEYKKYLREITTVHTKFHLKKVENARVYQFIKRKNYFYECKICQKVVAGYTNHMQHMNIHNKNKKKALSVPLSAPPQLSEVKATAKKTKLNVDAIEKEKSKSNNISKKLISQPFSSLPPPPPPPPKLKKQIKKLRKLSKKDVQAALVKVKVKPLLRQFPTQKYECKHCHMIFEGFHRLNLHQINTHSNLEYQKCNACAREFTTQTGLEEHAKNTHHTNTTLIKQKRKRKATNVASTDCCDNVDENCNTDCKRRRTTTTHLDVRMNGNGREQNKDATRHGNTNNIETLNKWTNAIAWLQDLLELSKRRQLQSKAISVSKTASTTQNKC